MPFSYLCLNNPYFPIVQIPSLHSPAFPQISAFPTLSFLPFSHLILDYLFVPVPVPFLSLFLFLPDVRCPINISNSHQPISAIDQISSLRIPSPNILHYFSLSFTSIKSKDECSRWLKHFLANERFIWWWKVRQNKHKPIVKNELWEKMVKTAFLKMVN